MNDHEVEVILTPERIKLYERGLPAIVVSMYGDRIQKLIDDEREACAKVCDQMEQEAEGTECCKWPTPADCAHAIRTRGTNHG